MHLHFFPLFLITNSNVGYLDFYRRLFRSSPISTIASTLEYYYSLKESHAYILSFYIEINEAILSWMNPKYWTRGYSVVRVFFYIVSWYTEELEFVEFGSAWKHFGEGKGEETRWSFSDEISSEWTGVVLQDCDTESFSSPPRGSSISQSIEGRRWWWRPQWRWCYVDWQHSSYSFSVLVTLCLSRYKLARHRQI